MIAYVDSSVVLRLVLGQPDRLAEWATITAGVTSALLEVECLRTLDRLRFAKEQFTAEQHSLRRAAIFRIVEAFEIVDLSPVVLKRAAQPMPTPLGTLDALHLATAQVWRDARQQDPVIATHDRALALAARADGFHVIGA